MATEDMKFVYAAYKMGVLDEHDKLFLEEFDAIEFRRVFTWWTHTNYGLFSMTADLRPEINTVGVWTVVSKSMRSERGPVGLVFGWVRGRVIEVGGMAWFPWASPRNKLEGAVAFFDTMRREGFKVLEFSELKDKRFFESIARHGIIKRVGHVHKLFGDGDACLYETKELSDGR